MNHREAYNLHASNGILFNHESPRRGETFVSRKITRAATRIAVGLQSVLRLGNLDAKRDWGYAPEYTDMMWRVLQQDTPDDYVCATGVTTTVRDFCKYVFDSLGVEIAFKGKGVEEVGFDVKTNKTLIEIDPSYFRPTEVDLLLGDYTKAKTILNWRPTVNVRELASIMVESDLKLANKEKN